MAKEPLLTVIRSIGAVEVLAGSMVGLAGCAPATNGPTDSVSPTAIEQSPTPTPTLEIGQTLPQLIEGQTADIGGINFEIHTIDGGRLAQIIGQTGKDWQILTDEQQRVVWGITQQENNQSPPPLILSPQSSSNMQWSPESMSWIDPDDNANQQLALLSLPQELIPHISAAFTFLDEGKTKTGVVLTGQLPRSQMSRSENFQDLGGNNYLLVVDPDVLIPEGFELSSGDFSQPPPQSPYRATNPHGDYFRVTLPGLNPPSIYGPIPNVPFARSELIERIGRNVQYGTFEGVPVIYKLQREEERGSPRLPPEDIGTPPQTILAYYDTENRRWVRTVPFDNMIVPHPEETNPELLDLQNPDAPIPQFVNALRNAGIEITPEQVLQGLTYQAIEVPKIDPQTGEVIKDEAGNEVRENVFLYYYRHPDTHRAMGFIAQQNESGEWEWEKINPRILDDLTTKVVVGTWLDMWDHSNDKLNKFSSFIATHALLRTWLETYGTSTIIEVLTIIRNQKQGLYLHPGIWHLDLDNKVKRLSTSQEMLSYLSEMAKNYMDYAERAHNSTSRPVYINFANEPWWADPPNNPINVGWLNSPYYNLLGENYLTEGYLAFYRAAEERGLRVGRDVRLILSVDGIFFPNKKLDLAITQIKTMRSQIAQELGIEPEEVQLDLAIQWRFDPTVTGGAMSSEGRYRLPTEDELKQALDQIKNAGIPFHITEFEIANVPNQQFDNLVYNFSTIAINYGALSISYGGTANTPNNPNTATEHSIFEMDIPTSTFYMFNRLLLDALSSQ